MEFNNFDARDVEPLKERTVLPAGWYKAVIVASEQKATRSQTGEYLQLTFEVIEGAHRGERLVDRLNLENPNLVAVEIARRALSGICRAVGVYQPKRSEDLHDRPLMVKVSVKPQAGEYGPSNEIGEYAAIQTGAPSGGAPASPTATAPPWKR